MGVNQLSNKPYRDNAVCKYFDRYDSTAFVNGQVNSSGFRQSDGMGGISFIDRVARSAQMVNANALNVNASGQTITFNYQPTNIKINGVDVTSNWTITDAGGGNWTIAPTSVATDVYNLVINDSRTYPCAEGNGTRLYDISSNEDHAITDGSWTTQNAYHYSFYEGYNNAKHFGGSNYVRFQTGWELANDFKVIIRDFVAFDLQSTNNTIFSTNGGFFFFINARLDAVTEFTIGIQTSEGFTEISFPSFNSTVNGAPPSLLDGRAHTIEVQKSSVGNGSDNGVKLIIDGVDYGYDTTIADTTLPLIAQATISGISLYTFTSSQNLENNFIGDVEYYTIADVLIRRWVADDDFNESDGTAPISSSIVSINAPAGTANEDVFGKQLEFKGYRTTRKWNGASDIRFPNITEVNISLRGNTFTFDQIQTGQILVNSKTINGLMNNVLVVDTRISEVHKSREFNNTSPPERTFTYDFSFIATPPFTKDNITSAIISQDTLVSPDDYQETDVTVPTPYYTEIPSLGSVSISVLYFVTSQDIIDAGGTLYLVLNAFDEDASGTQLITNAQNSRTDAGPLTLDRSVLESLFTQNVHFQLQLTDTAPV